eukprot:m.65805 g.65805  ORF g.65805 m.65805 type:complete len:52 (-) comp12075_c0_seq2:99-254(-)
MLPRWGRGTSTTRHSWCVVMGQRLLDKTMAVCALNHNTIGFTGSTLDTKRQ